MPGDSFEVAFNSMAPHRDSRYFAFGSYEGLVANMDAQELAVKAPRYSLALELLVEVIDDPKAKARERLEAVQMLKKGLFWLKFLLEAQETAPDLRKDLIEVLRRYRRSSAVPCRKSAVGHLTDVPRPDAAAENTAV